MSLVWLEKHLMWFVTYFLIMNIHKITGAESVKKHIGDNCRLDLCTIIFQKVMAAIFQYSGHFQHENHFFEYVSPTLSDLNDLGIKSYILDHAESEFRPQEFSNSVFYQI